MGHELPKEEILNVFREHHPQTLTPDDLAESLSVHRRTAQNYVRDLEEDGHLVVASKGKPMHWQLADHEPKEPIYREELAKAKRIGGKTKRSGLVMLFVSFGALAAAGLITSNHHFAEAFGLSFPIDASQAAIAVWVGVGGSLLFGLSAIAIVFGKFLPWIVEWKLDETTPREG